MNIIEMYDNYRMQHATKFKKILKRITKEILLITENLPEDVVLENFKTNPERKYLYLEERRGSKDFKEGFLIISFGDGNKIGQYPYNVAAIKELDKFLATYYPGIIVNRCFILDLYNRTIEFSFGFYVEFENTDFEFKENRSILILKDSQTKKSVSDESRHLFNADIAELLQCSFTDHDWEELHKYVFFDEKHHREYKTSYYDCGTVCITLSVY